MSGLFAMRGRTAVDTIAGSGAAERLSSMVGRAPDSGELLDLLGRAGRNVEISTALLRELMRSWPDGDAKRLELVDVEHANDGVTHDIVHHLHQRIAVPFDRSDILALASGLDDVVDYAEEVADLMGLYRVEAPMDQAVELTDTLAAAGVGGRPRPRCPRRRATTWARPSATSRRSTGSRTKATGSSAPV